MKLPVLFLVGPTAVGKSQAALLIAKKLKGEIISADSMLVYRGMDIGTAKPSRAELKRIPHHLIDIVKPSSNFSVFQYRRLALKKIGEIVRKGKLPIVTGGSGLYVRALLKGIAPFPGTDRKLRVELEKELKTENGLQSLLHRLQELDPERAATIDSRNPRRVIRALEIALQSGQDSGKIRPKEEPLSELGFTPLVIGITKDRQALYQDIEVRVDRMFKKGLVKEVRGLLKGRLSKTARQAVGYKEVIGFLIKEYDLKRAVELVKINTRHLAKRQWTWFKREEGILWMEVSAKESLKDLVERIVNLCGAG